MPFTSWTELTSSAAFTGRKAPRGVVHNNRMYLVAGDDGSPSKSAEVWRSFDGITWTLLTSSPGWVGRSVHGLVSDGTYIYVFGGSTNSGFLRDIWRSSDGISWTEMNSSCDWNPRHEFAYAYLNSAIYVYGGYGSASGAFSFMSRYNDVWRSDDGGVNWTSLGNAPWSARREMAFTVFDGKMWCLGGDTGSFQDNDVWWSSDGISWTQQSDALWSTRREHQAFEFDNKLWIVAGYSAAGGGVKNDTWYTPDGENWTEYITSPTYTARVDASALFFNNGVHIIAGEV